MFYCKYYFNGRWVAKLKTDGTVAGATTLSIMTFSITTFRIMTFNITVNKMQPSA